MIENDFTILLTDEEGSEIECELLDKVEYEGNTYCVLLPIDDDSSEPEAIILREEPSGELCGFDAFAFTLDHEDLIFRAVLEQQVLQFALLRFRNPVDAGKLIFNVD